MSESLAASDTELRRLGRYEVLVDLGSDGFVSVVAARVRGPNVGPRIVELAKVEAGLAREAEIKAAFLSEARAAGRIRHAHFVQPTDTLVHEGDLFVATEFVHGARLEEVVRAAADQGVAIAPSVSVRIILDVLAGLSAVHATAAGAGTRPLVHGDICPSNVLVSYRGSARLLHSGLSWAKGRSGGAGSANRRLPYKAPEQLRSGVNAVPIDPAADLFAVGVLMWEMLSGGQLFEGPAEVEVIDQILHRSIPPLASMAHGRVPAALGMLVDLALQRDPDHRTSSALDFAAAIEEAVGPDVGSVEDVAMLIDRVLGPAIEARREQLEARIAQAELASQPPSGPRSVDSETRRLAGSSGLSSFPAARASSGQPDRKAWVPDLGALPGQALEDHASTEPPAFRLPDAAELMRPTEPRPASLPAPAHSSAPKILRTPSVAGASRTPSVAVALSRTPSVAGASRTPSVPGASRTPSISRIPLAGISRMPSLSARPVTPPRERAPVRLGLFIGIGVALGALLVGLFFLLPQRGRESGTVGRAGIETQPPSVRPTSSAGGIEVVGAVERYEPAPSPNSPGPEARELAEPPFPAESTTQVPAREAPARAVRKPPPRRSDGIPPGI